MTRTRLLLILGICLLLISSAAPGIGSDVLQMKVTPPITFAPGQFTVRVSVDVNADNRLLAVAVESRDFYRSSQIQINGSDGPRVNVVHFANLPAGDYEVSGVLVGTRGPRASMALPARVAPGVGSQR